MKRMPRKDFIYIIIFWIVLTGLNLNKAFHVDDTFHLYAAGHILNDPLHPMSGTVNWNLSPEPIRNFNQPPLFFYFLAFAKYLVGDGEIGLHLFFSVFTFLALYFFYRLLQLVDARNKVLLLILFSFCPAMVVNQNLMTDIPLLSFSLATMYFLMHGVKTQKTTSFIYFALFLSVGLLIKYSLLPVFVVGIISILLSGNQKKSWVFVIPLIIILLWSGWNYFEFGAAHIVNRHKPGFYFLKIPAFLGTFGAVLSFSAIFIYWIYPNKTVRNSILLLSVLFISLIPLVFFGKVPERISNQLLLMLFVVNGAMVAIVLIFYEILKFKNLKQLYFITDDFPIVLYLAGITLFIVIGVPFNATRHVLLLVPFILILSRDIITNTMALIKVHAVAFTVIFGIMHGVSDWLYADFYRKNADKIEVADKTVYSIGHWGWQWYSEKKGMKIYDHNRSREIKPGDIIVFPADISKQKLHSLIKVDTLYFLTQAPNFLTIFSGKDFASMYNSFHDKPAWSFSCSPIDTVFVCRVE
jgi:hypothetical protein